MKRNVLIYHRQHQCLDLVHNMCYHSNKQRVNEGNCDEQVNGLHKYCFHIDVVSKSPLHV